MLPRDVFVVAAARTPIGRYGGGLGAVHPAELGAVAARRALEQARVAPEAVDLVTVGQARQAGSGPNPARQVVRRAGLPDTVPAWTVNQACASGLQAVVEAARALALDEGAIAVAGGIESMSRVPYLVDADHARWGKRMGHFPLVDAMQRDGFTCSLCGMIMGETAELLAREYGITREQSDAYALESQRRAAAAVSAGRFADELAPVTVPGAKGDIQVAADEHPRPDTTAEGLARLSPVFPDAEGRGIITAGSSSGLTDGGAAVVLATGDAVRRHALTPLARILGWSIAALDPRRMGIGPVPAIRTLLSRLALTLDDFDLVELNEAFAAQVLAVLADTPIDRDRLNVNGGAVALGHPIGCTGTRILVTLVHELRRRGASRGLATLCVSGGQGVAMAVEAAPRQPLRNEKGKM